MRALRTVAIALLACIGAAGATAAVLWSASLAGLGRAEVVSSSAMAPAYEQGDLVIVTRVPADGIESGDVLSVGGDGVFGQLERVVSVDMVRADRWSVVTTATSGADPSERTVGSQAWAPTLRVPAVGGVVAAAVEPALAISGLSLVLLLVAVALLGRPPAAPLRGAV